MQLGSEQIQRFNYLFSRLLVFAADCLGIDDELIDREHFQLDAKVIDDVMYRLWEGGSTIYRFIEENPYCLNKQDLQTVESWLYGIIGRFVILEHTEAGSIFVGSGERFLVVGINENLEKLVPSPPVELETIILPFEGKIVEGMLIDTDSITTDQYDFEIDFESVPGDKPLITAAERLIKASKELGERWDEEISASVGNFFDALLHWNDHEEVYPPDLR